MNALQIFIVLLITGLTLVGAEIFVPGGILGAVGGLALTIACGVGFLAFPGLGWYVTAAIVLLVGLAVALWIRVFPRTRMGRRMTVSTDLHLAKATADGLDVLLGQTGVAVCDLRPSGYALIDGRRVDVLTQGGTIAKDEPVRVVQVVGNRVVVKRDEAALNPEPEPMYHNATRPNKRRSPS